MIHFVVAFAVMAHVLCWGAGLAMIAMPRAWRRFWPVLVVPAGLALQSAVVWVGAAAGLKGTNSYAWWSQVVPAGLLAVGACVVLLVKASESQRLWILSVSILVMLAAFVAPAPVPVLMAGMAMAGMVAVLLDQFSPDTLRWRVVGALALYAGAALGYMLYGRYLVGVDATAWAEAIGGQQEAQATLSQGRAFLNTLATWGLWLILPLGYLSLLVQGLLAHPPVGARPAETISAVRTRGG